MAEEYLENVEWKIENFCSWNSVTHPTGISSPGVLQEKKAYFLLYPRGFDDFAGHLVIQIKNPKCANISGELALLGPDGSLLSLHLINTQSDNEFYQGPKYDDVVTHIRNKEIIHKDSITIRCCFKSRKQYAHQMTSSIDVSDTTLKVDSSSMINFMENEETEVIADIKCLRDGFEMCLKLDVVDETISFTLEACENIPITIGLEFCLSFVNREGTVLDEVKKVFNDELEDLITGTLLHVIKREEVHGKDFTSLILHFKFISGRIRECHNKICCLAQEVTPAQKHSDDSLATSFQVNKSFSVLSKDLMCLYQEKEFCDFELKCDGVTFPVHRNILSARSPVFKRLFLCDMIEAASGKMDIIDLDAPTLGLFLTHLYTGSAKEMNFESCLNLYYAADKYDVPTLKEECAHFMRDNISISNVCSILSLAYKYHDLLLIDAGYVFILRNYLEVTGSDEWKTFLQDEPLPAALTLARFAEKKYVGRDAAKFFNIPSIKDFH